MELLLIAILVAGLLFAGIRKLWESATANKRIAKPDNQMLFMSEALDISTALCTALIFKTEQRSLEIAKADGRFLVTPTDMKQAYEEIIREEHM